MPRIDASTVAEHHDLHLSRLLDAAVAYAAEHDVASLTLAELAKRTGRSRASLYAYFGSTEEMRVTLCIHALSSWISGLLDELRTIADLDERLDRLVTVQIAERRDPAIGRVTAYAFSLQTEPARARVRAALQPLTAELLAIVDQLGVEPPSRAASMVQGAIAAASDQVRLGADADRVAADTVTFIRAGLAALGAGHAPPAAGRERRSVAPLPDVAAGPTGPSALAFVAAPSLAVGAVDALHRRTSTPVAPVTPRRAHRRLARVAVAQLVWAALAFVTGVAGVGAAVHTFLGLSIAALLVWTVRTLRAAPLSAPSGTTTAAVLAVLAAAAAIAARAEQVGAALVAHVVLAGLVLVALAVAARSAHRARAAVPGAALVS